MINLTFVVDQSDLRMTYLYDELWAEGFNTKKYRRKEEYLGKVCYSFSPAKKFSREEVQDLKSNSILFCGNNPFGEILAVKHIEYHNLMKDEFYNYKNANLTAEAIIMLLIQNTVSSINSLNILLLGYGRVAGAAAKLFTKLNLNFSVATYDITERNRALLVTDKVYDLMPPLNLYDCIINTVPAQIFTKESLGEIKSSALILDVASDSVISKSEQLGLKATYMHQTGLPGKYTPKTAGTILKNSILTTLTENIKMKSEKL